jgi:hypothetical protein
LQFERSVDEKIIEVWTKYFAVKVLMKYICFGWGCAFTEQWFQNLQTNDNFSYKFLSTLLASQNTSNINFWSMIILVLSKRKLTRKSKKKNDKIFWHRIWWLKTISVFFVYHVIDYQIFKNLPWKLYYLWKWHRNHRSFGKT